MIRRSWISCFVAVTFLMVPRAFAQDSPKLKLVDSVKFQAGYIDNQFAVSPDGKLLAYVTVRQNGNSTLILRDLESKNEKTADLTKFTDDPVLVFFLPDNNGLVVAAQPDSKINYSVFDLDAREITQIRNQDHFFWRTVDNKVQPITYRVDRQATSITHTISLYEAGNLRKVARTLTLRTDAANRFTFKGENLELISFAGDFTRATVKIIGGYNKATDSKFPDVQGEYDLESQNVVKGENISNNALWDRDAAWFARNWHHRTPIRLSGVPVVAGIDGTFQIGKGILSWQDIQVKFQLGRFDFDSFHQHPVQMDPKNTLFAMSVHPQNPVTLQQKRSEKRAWHFFSLNTETAVAVALGQVPVENTVISWNAGGKTLAVMRLSPNWKIGADTLEIYRLP